MGSCCQAHDNVIGASNMMAAHQGLMSDCALQCDIQADSKAIWQTVCMLQLCYIHEHTRRIRE